MARLLVVSRSMALAMRIADDHDVLEYPVEALDELTPAPDVEAVVLDLGEPQAAMQALDRLRGAGVDTRVLIVSGYQPAWKDLVALDIDRVVVVPLPITRAALLDGLDRLLGVTPLVPRVPPAPPSAPAAPPPPPRTLVPGPDADQPAPALPVRPLPVRPLPPGTAPRGAAARPPAAAPPAAAAPTGPPLFAAPAAPAADAAPVDDGNGDGRRRPGLARWLTTSSPRPSFPVPEGSPLDGGHAASRGGAPSTPPAGSPRPPADEPDLFRPVVEPQVPVRSPATLPSRPGAGRSPAPAPAAPMPAPAARAVPAAAPAPAPAPARPAVTPPPRPPEQVEPPPAAPPRPLAPAPEPGGPAPVGRPERGGRLGRGRGRDPREQHPGFTPAAGVPASPQARPVADGVQEWVRALLEHRSELFGVGETAQVLADEVIERAEADATAVLVPDGDRWRVSGGVGLRPLERRLLLDTTHWLISEIAVGGRALLIEDTDIVRPRLAGAPLAAWRHILAVPVPPIRAAVVLARGQEAARFTETDLAAVVPLVAEAGPLLQAALRMRELARALGPLRDLDG